MTCENGWHSLVPKDARPGDAVCECGEVTWQGPGILHVNHTRLDCPDGSGSPMYVEQVTR